ncbi:expressed protein [Echinococcus multilocularis]|uniref:Expressed protein n=1 Tax=Echinococcus multilocularis TaxID=6211 RepID=A0A068YIP8_ECHMU|nr:expressed protein [Echinococcus multilocularis]
MARESIGTEAVINANVSQIRPHFSLYRPILEPPIPMTQRPPNQSMEGRVPFITTALLSQTNSRCNRGRGM